MTTTMLNLYKKAALYSATIESKPALERLSDSDRERHAMELGTALNNYNWTPRKRNVIRKAIRNLKNVL